MQKLFTLCLIFLFVAGGNLCLVQANPSSRPSPSHPSPSHAPLHSKSTPSTKVTSSTPPPPPRAPSSEPPRGPHYTQRNNLRSSWYMPYSILFSVWFWVLALALGAPFLAVRLARYQQRRSFIRARNADLANPRNATARFQLGLLYRKQRRYRKAQLYLQQAYDIEKNNGDLDPRLAQALGDVLLQRGEPQRAIPIYLESLEKDPSGNQGEVFLALGRAWWKNDDLEQAHPWLEQACQANASLAEPVFRLATFHHKHKNTDRGKTLLQEFLADAHTLPRFARRRNRFWIWMMRAYPWSCWLL